jgi:hypothetical protein
MTCVASIPGRTRPGHGPALPMACAFPCGETATHRSQTIHPARQVSSRNKADLDVGHIYPTSVSGGEKC